jgi:hypothetical protein
VRQLGGVSPELVFDAYLAGEPIGAIAHPGIEFERCVDPVRQQDVVEHRQVFEQLELLEDHADAADPEVWKIQINFL